VVLRLGSGDAYGEPIGRYLSYAREEQLPKNGVLQPIDARNYLILMARLERFELPTPWFVAKYSIQLSYRRVMRVTVATVGLSIKFPV
jgi:hypothetical protein